MIYMKAATDKLVQQVVHMLRRPEEVERARVIGFCPTLWEPLLSRLLKSK